MEKHTSSISSNIMYLRIEYWTVCISNEIYLILLIGWSIVASTGFVL